MFLSLSSPCGGHLGLPTMFLTYLHKQKMENEIAKKQHCELSNQKPEKNQKEDFSPLPTKEPFKFPNVKSNEKKCPIKLTSLMRIIRCYFMLQYRIPRIGNIYSV